VFVSGIRSMAAHLQQTIVISFTAQLHGLAHQHNMLLMFC
jgi:hypothetical protein